MEASNPSSPSAEGELVVCPNCDAGYHVPLQVLQRNQVRLRCISCKEIFPPPLEFQNTIPATPAAVNTEFDALGANLGAHTGISAGNMEWENTASPAISTNSSQADAFGAAGVSDSPDFLDINNPGGEDVSAAGAMDAGMGLDDATSVSFDGDAIGGMEVDLDDATSVSFDGDAIGGMEVDLDDATSVSFDGDAIGGMEVDLDDATSVSFDGDAIGGMEVDLDDHAASQPVPDITDMVEEIEREEVENLSTPQENEMGVEEVVMGLDEEAELRLTEPAISGDAPPFGLGEEVLMPDDSQTPPPKADTPSFWRRLFSRNKKALSPSPAEEIPLAKPSLWHRLFSKKTAAHVGATTAAATGDAAGMAAELARPSSSQTSSLAETPDALNDPLDLGDDVDGISLSGGEGELSVDLGDDVGEISLSGGEGELSVDLGDDVDGISLSGGEGELSVDLGDDVGEVSLSGDAGELSVDLGDDVGEVSLSGDAGELSVDLGDDVGEVSLSGDAGELSVDLGDDVDGLSLSADLGNDDTDGSEEHAYMAATDIGVEAISGENIPDEERFDLFLKPGEKPSATEAFPTPVKADGRKYGLGLKKRENGWVGWFVRPVCLGELAGVGGGCMQTVTICKLPLVILKKKYCPYTAWC